VEEGKGTGKLGRKGKAKEPPLFGERNRMVKVETSARHLILWLLIKGKTPQKRAVSQIPFKPPLYRKTGFF